MLLELANNLGIDPKKTSNINGGEFHSACPSCGDGIDRFIIWPTQDRYWCRRCDKKGDAIQFCRDFLGMTFQEASRKINPLKTRFNQNDFKHPIIEKVVIATEPTHEWQCKAKKFVNWAQKQLKRSAEIMNSLYKRGFSESTIAQFKLGASSQDFYRERTDWGLLKEGKEDGKFKKLWLPAGIVIPTISIDDRVLKLKVRRNQCHQDDYLPKYIEISGSMHCPSIYGNIQHEVIVVLESELDSLLVQQAAQDLCYCIALGGVTKKPDFYTDHLLRKSSLILWCLDNDESGKKAALWWYKTYPQLKFWPAPIGKSPGDALKDHGLNLREWIKEGITHRLKEENI